MKVDSTFLYVGYGGAIPVVSNDTAENRKPNRRVEIIVSGESGNIEPR